MKMTETLKRRFVKDTNLPIHVFAEPYFSHFLDLYENQFEAKSKYAMFQELLTHFADEQDYLEMYNKVKDDVINYLANNPAMQHFSRNEDMTKFPIRMAGFPSSSVFKIPNVGKYFVSIDMVKANFTALKHYNPAIVAATNSYDEFIGLFTECEYIKQSKYIRQVIFGNQNPKRQTHYEKYLMDGVLADVFDFTKISAASVAYFGTDEIVLDISDYVHDGVLDEQFELQMNQVLNRAKANHIQLRAEYFKLYKINGTSGYMKKFMFATACKKTVDFKCVNSLEMPFVIRAYNNETPTDEDFVFIYEGKMARLLDAFQVEFVDKISE